MFYKRFCLLAALLFFLSCSKSGINTQQEIHVRVRLPQDPETLNPVNFKNIYGRQIINLLFQSLLYTNDLDGKYKPILAHSLPVIIYKDSLAFITYQIREEAVWDNATTVTAEDVVFSVKAIKCPLVNNEKQRMRYEAIQDVQTDAADPKKLTFVCSRFAPNLDILTGDISILPAYLFDPKGLLKKFTLSELIQNFEDLSKDTDIQSFAAWFNTENFSWNKHLLLGSGAYTLTDWKTGQYIMLQKKENWWLDQLTNKPDYLQANPERINFKIIPENTTALLSLRSGSIDVYSNIPASDFLQLTQDPGMKKNYDFFTPETYDFTYIGINSRLEKFADRKTRRALAHLMDVDNMIQITQKSFAVRSVGPIKPGDTNYNTKIKQYPHDVTKAVELLQEAGWQKQDGQWIKIINEEKIPLTIHLQYKAGNVDYEKIALIFKQSASQAGIPVEIQPMEGKALSGNLNSHRFEMFVRGISGSPLEYDFKPILHTESAIIEGGNYTGFGTNESDTLIEAINRTSDLSLKARYLKRFQEVLYQEANPIFLFAYQNRIAINKRFTHVKISASKSGYEINTLTLSSPTK